MKKQTEETILRNQLRDYLRLRGWYVIRIQQGLGCHKGISDLIAIKGGDVLFIETKSKRGKMSEYQEKFKQEVIEHGGMYACVSDFDEFVRGVA